MSSPQDRAFAREASHIKKEVHSIDSDGDDDKNDDDQTYDPSKGQPSAPATAASVHYPQSRTTPTAPRGTPNASAIPARSGGSSEVVPPRHTMPIAGSASDAPLRSVAVLRLPTERGEIRCLAVNPRGTILVSGGTDGSLCMYDFSKELESSAIQPTRVLTPFVNRVKGFQSIISAHFSTDGSYLVACQDGDYPVLVSSNGKQMGNCAIGERGMMDVVKCQGHRAPVTCSAPMIELDLQSTYCGGDGDDDSRDASSQSLCPQLFLTGSQDGTARVWDSTSYTRKSTYAIKHGSGQLMDTFIVESVLGLRGLGGAGSVFATGGSDGCVQVWDSRVPFRPAGHMLKLTAVPKAGGRSAGMNFLTDEVHVGGMSEMADDSPLLAVRTGAAVRVFDLRAERSSAGSGSKPRAAGIGGISRMHPSSMRGAGAGLNRGAPKQAPTEQDSSMTLPDLPLFRDTALVIPFMNPSRALEVLHGHAPAPSDPDAIRSLLRKSPPSLLTFTSSEGYGGVGGGHLLEITKRQLMVEHGAVPLRERFHVRQSWLVSPTEHVTAVAVDHAHGIIFAGLSNGDIMGTVVGRLEVSRNGTMETTTHSGFNGKGSEQDASVLTWLDSRPLVNPKRTAGGHRIDIPKGSNRNNDFVDDDDDDDGKDPKSRKLELY